MTLSHASLLLPSILRELGLVSDETWNSYFDDVYYPDRVNKRGRI